MRRSTVWWLVTVLCILTLLAACGGGTGGGGGTPGAETPSALTLPFSVPVGTSGTHVRADALTRSGRVWVQLDGAVASAGSLSLPAQLPSNVGLLTPDVGAELCPGASSAPTPSATPSLWLELRELWLTDGATLTALRRSTRPGLSLEDPSGYQAGDVILHWVYSDRSLTLTGACSYPFGITRTLALTLSAGWTAIATQVDAIDAGSGFPSAMTTRNATASDDAVWHAAEVVLANADAIWAPASAEHGDRASWWGSNQNKLVRSGDELWLSVVDNGGAEPLARVVRRVGDGWTTTGTWPSQSPAQLVLVAGEPWTLVHEVDVSATSDTLGSVTVVDRTGAAVTTQTPSNRVNVRFGATVSAEGALLVAWGERVSFPDQGTTREDVSFQTLDAGTGSWSGFALSDLDVSYRYPYVVQDDQRLVAAVAENTFMGSGQENRYHKLLLVQASVDSSFAVDALVIDVAAELPELADTRPRLVEISDLTIDANGDAHVLVKVFDGPTASSPPSLWHRVAPAVISGSEERPEDPPLPAAPAWSAWATLDALTCSWARFVTIPGTHEPTVACVHGSHLSITTLDGTRSIALRVPPGVDGPYLYVAEGRSGSATDAQWIDLFVIAGSASAYPNGPALVVSVPRLEVAAALDAP